MTNFGGSPKENSDTQEAVVAKAADTAVVVPDSTDTPDTSSDVVGGPAVVSAEDVADLPEPEPLFEGTTSVEDRTELDANAAEAQVQNAADTRALANAQAKEDADFRTNYPDSPVARAANPSLGGEQFFG